MTDEQKELEELRKYKAEKEMTVEQKELEELREYKAAQEKEQKNENRLGCNHFSLCSPCGLPL